MLDTTTLRLTFGIVALTLFVLFFVTFRQTRSGYSSWWCAALVLLLFGSAAFLLNGTAHQVWANPFGNSLLVMGTVSVWAGARSLRTLRPKLWQLAAPPALTAVASAWDTPATNIWSGGPVFLAMMTLTIALASRELWLLKPNYSRVQRAMAVASGALAAYYFCRWMAFLAGGPYGPVFITYFGSAVTTLVSIVYLVIVSFSMTALSHDQLVNDLHERATRDGLTGLLNRTAFLDLAAAELHQLSLTKTTATLILADLDHFKMVNDKYGHAAGDSALKAFAAACIATVRSTDLVGRYGGEEFILLLPGANPDRAEAIATEISRHLAAAKTPDIQYPTVSFGTASNAAGNADLGQMIASADTALYRAKSTGRNRVVRAAAIP